MKVIAGFHSKKDVMKPRYNLPKGMRYSTLKERKEFYQREFRVEKVEKWFEDWREQVKFAVIMGRHTGIFLKKIQRRRLNNNYRRRIQGFR